MIKKLDEFDERKLADTSAKAPEGPSIYVRFGQNDFIHEYFIQATEAFFLEVGYDCIFMRGTNFETEEERVALKEATENVIDNIDDEI